MSSTSDAVALTTALAPLGMRLIEAGLRAVKGETSKEQAAHETLDALLDEMPREYLVTYLTREGIRRAEFAADLAELAKFGP